MSRGGQMLVQLDFWQKSRINWIFNLIFDILKILIGFFNIHKISIGFLIGFFYIKILNQLDFYRKCEDGLL